MAPAICVTWPLPLHSGQVEEPPPLDPAKQPQVVRVEGTAPASSSTVRSTLDDKFSTEYDLSGGGADNAWTLTMKPSVETALEQKTVDQAIETITQRVFAVAATSPDPSTPKKPTRKRAQADKP